MDGFLVIFLLSSLFSLSFLCSCLCDCCCPIKPPQEVQIMEMDKTPKHSTKSGKKKKGKGRK